MTDQITKALFDHLVELAALDLSPEEAEYLRHQLNNQLKAIHELEAIPLGPETETTSYGVPYTAAIRPAERTDEWIPYPTPDELLAQAPEVDGRYIVVPDIPHEELD
jgi:aspartyl-tRNA(Asn)/glutamyl-tRNA(Gln) amidotransferase subunit C